MTDYFNVRLPDDEIRAISSIGLAHLGDGVYELLVRAWLCAHGRATGKGLHRAAVELVKAPAQAERAERILPLLTEEEAAVYKRGRNQPGTSVPGAAASTVPQGRRAEFCRSDRFLLYRFMLAVFREKCYITLCST